MQRKLEIAFSIFVVLVVAWFIWQAVGAGPLTPAAVRAREPEGSLLRELAESPLYAQLMPRGWGQKSALFPLVIGIPTLLLALLQLAIDLRARHPASAPAVPPAGTGVPPEVVRRRTAVILAATVGFVLATWLFGFTVAVPLVTLLYLRFGAGEGWPISIILTGVAGIAFYVIFVQGLGVPMPPGIVVNLLMG